MTTLLQNLNLEQLKTHYASNSDFQNAVYEYAWDNEMFCQEEWANEMLGKENRGYKYNDHYTSFYFTLTDAERFVADVPKSCRDYLPDSKTELYDKAKRLLAEWGDMTYEEQDANEGFFAKLEGAATELLQAIENTLHEFENITDESIENMLQQIINGCSPMSNWELLDDGKTIAEHITKLCK